MHARHRSRFRGRNLPSTFAQEMASYGASDAWDFTTQTYIRGGVLAPSGITFTRASVGSYLNSNNTMTVFSPGQPRIGDKGLLIEGIRQNLFLNSAVGATQSVTVTAAAHTLSFYGTGTVTLSGVSTDGPLVGTGEFDRVSLTFTPTAGSLTLTVSGDIKWVNLELGSFPTSWIPTEGTAVTRAADSSIVVNFVSSALVATGTGFAKAIVSTIATGDKGTVSFVDGNGRLIEVSTATIRSFDGANVVSSGVSATANIAYKAATAWSGNSLRIAANGNATRSGVFDGAMGSVGNLLLGQRASGAELQGYLQQVAIFPIAFTDAQLQDITK